MGTLFSKEFSGDPKLEACAVSDPAHVVPGSIGSHVGKIQNALIKVDGALIDGTEITQQKYGPTTTQAVVNFKKRYQILNYAGQIDNIVGKKTIRALDNGLQGKSPSPAVPPGAKPPAKKPSNVPPKPSPPKGVPIPPASGSVELPAVLIQSSGEVWVRFPGTAEAVQGFPGMMLRKNTVVQTMENGNAVIHFPDATRAVLPPRSLLVIYGSSKPGPPKPPPEVIINVDELNRALDALRKGKLP